MMLECSTGELLARAAFMHHDDQGYDALMHHAVLKGFKGYSIPQKVPVTLMVTMSHLLVVRMTQTRREPGGSGSRMMLP